jgi:hypothetical protein
MQFIRHEIVEGWHENKTQIPGGEATLMIRVHGLIYRPADKADEAILKSLIGKINSIPFIGCDAECLICVNSNWSKDIKVFRPEQYLADLAFGRSERPKADSMSDEWTVEISELARPGWNAIYEQVADGKTQRGKRNNHPAVDFAAILGDVSIG